MGFFGDLLGAAMKPIASAGAALGSTFLGQKLFGEASYDEQLGDLRENAERANAMEQHNYKHRYQWAVDDMRKAGLNPILAATQGLGGGSARAFMAQAPQRMYPSKGGEEFSAIGKSQLTDQKTKESKSVTQMNKDKSKEILASAHLKRKKAKLVSAQELETYQNITALRNKAWEHMQRISLLAEQTNLARDSAAHMRMQQTVAKHAWKKLEQERKNLQLVHRQLKAQLPMLERFSEIYSAGSGATMAWMETFMRSMRMNIHVGFMPQQ